ncbi:MAG: Rieske (2Fe-2S) protein [Vampirovibrio sp.]|jgi:cytochrome b6-f complex iron-sulfur subunit|nr:Rieske (2Fe-2S) protein [Vampirovibrio sp.]
MMMMMATGQEEKIETPPTFDYSAETAGETMSRRLFMGGMIGVFGAVMAAVAAGPLLSYLWPPKSTAIKIDKLVLGKVAEFPAGTSKNFKFGSIPALFIHSPDGSMHAFNATCSHLGCTVQYQQAKNNIYCACHGGTYDPATGNVVAGPPPEGLHKLLASVEAGEIVIRPEKAGAKA